LENLPRRQTEDSFDFSKAEKILIAVARLVLSEGKSTFSSEELRRALDLFPEEWMAEYRSVFKEMEAASSDRKANNRLFYEVQHGFYRLTKEGQDLIGKLQKM